MLRLYFAFIRKDHNKNKQAKKKYLSTTLPLFTYYSIFYVALKWKLISRMDY